MAHPALPIMLAVLLLLAQQQSPAFRVRSSAWTEGGTCVADIELLNDSAAPVELNPEELTITYRGVVSNSACKAHTVPARVEGRVNGIGRAAHVLVRASDCDRERCVETASVELLGADGRDQRRIVSVAPGEGIILRIRFQHEHFLFGRYDPLIGQRELLLSWGPVFAKLRLVHEQPQSFQGAGEINLEPSPSRQDPTFYSSAPGSLYLAADIPGYQYYRFADVPVRYGSYWLLRFRYAIALGTTASCRVRIVEYQDAPRYWRRLGGGFDCELVRQGGWVTFERRFRVGPETTTLALDFRLTGSDVGEMWVDDVQLIPLPLAKTSP